MALGNTSSGRTRRTRPQWSTEGVQVFADCNHDTGGLSAELSDAPFDGDGYETKIFDSGIGDDPDLAWIRVNAGNKLRCNLLSSNRWLAHPLCWACCQMQAYRM